MYASVRNGYADAEKHENRRDIRLNLMTMSTPGYIAIPGHLRPIPVVPWERGLILIMSCGQKDAGWRAYPVLQSKGTGEAEA